MSPTHSPSAGHRRQASVAWKPGRTVRRAHAATDELLAAATASAQIHWRVYVGAERARTYRRALACFSARNAKCRAVERHRAGTFHS